MRVMFNLVDRLSGFYISIQDQPEFMNSLEDSVSDQLKTVLAPTLSSSEIDDMEIILSIGQTVAESQQMYERFRFVVTDQSKERDAYFQFFGERVAAKVGAPGNQDLTSAAFLCASAVIPAFKKLFDDATQPAKEVGPEKTKSVESSASDHLSSASQLKDQGVQTIKLVRVISRVSGEEAVDTWWGVHPQFQRDLKPHEAKELAQHMNRVTRILGERFAVVTSSSKPTEGHQQVGHA
jgi:hypothetical protein